MGKHKSKSKKKSHKKKHSSSSSSNTDSDNAEMEWVEAPKETKRDSWMTEETFIPTLSKEEMFPSSQKKTKRQEELEVNKKIQESRELNPYMKKEGKGLPEEDVQVDSLSLPTSSVGDGGYSWLKKAYQRIQEQSEEEGRSMEEIAVERWGSLDKLLSMLDEAKARREKRQDIRSFQNCRYKDQRHEYNRERKPKFMRPEQNDHSDDEPQTSERSIKFSKPSHSRREKHHYFSSSSHKSKYKDYHSIPESSPSQKFQTVKEERKPSWKKDTAYNLPEQETLKTSAKNRENEESDDHPHLDNTKNLSELDPISQLLKEGNLTKLSAKCFKAELMGDVALATKLKARIDQLRSNPEPAAARGHSVREESVILTKTDNRGQLRPLNLTEHEELDEMQKQRGQRKKIFNDSKCSLKQMFEKEKLITSEDHIESFFQVASKSRSLSDLDYDMDDVSKNVSEKMSHSRMEERDIKKAMHAHQRLNSALERCEYCLDRPNAKSHLLVHIDDKVYLSLPNYLPMVEGHCLIVPKNHVSSFLQLDEDEWIEVEALKKALMRFFEMQEKCVTFLETSLNFHRCPHAIMECIPMPKETGELAPLYFKKAIQESEKEWAQNKKLVELSSKGVRYSIPCQFPYFCVNFDPKIHPGFAHVIEDEKSFPRNFGKEVIGGMLDIDYNHLYKNKKAGVSLSKQVQEVLAFQKLWKNFAE